MLWPPAMPFIYPTRVVACPNIGSSNLYTGSSWCSRNVSGGHSPQSTYLYALLLHVVPPLLLRANCINNQIFFEKSDALRRALKNDLEAFAGHSPLDLAVSSLRLQRVLFGLAESQTFLFLSSFSESVTMPAATSEPLGRPGNSTLPLDQAPLDALAYLRTSLGPAQRVSAVAKLIESLPSPGDSSNPGVVYALKRLVEGVAVSSGGARENMSLALAALARCVAGEKKTIDVVVKSIFTVYGPKGTFVTDYSGAERERAIGALTACVAVASSAWEIAQVRGASDAGKEGATVSRGKSRKGDVALISGQPTLSGEAAHELVVVLHAAATANNGKWALGVPCVHAVRNILKVVPRRDYDDVLAKPLVKWCRERSCTADGVALAMVLHVESRVLPAAVMSSIYPKREAFFSALMDCFEHGFPLWPQPDANGDELPSVPIQWLLALQFVVDGSSASRSLLGTGGIGAFWADFVATALVLNSSSMEKKTLAVALLPHAVHACTSVDDFSSLLSDNVAAFLGNVLSGRSGTAAGVRKRKSDHHMASRLHGASAALGKATLDVIRVKQRQGMKTAGVWVRRLFVWATRNRIASKLFKGNSVQFGLSLMSDADVDLLFQSVVSTLADPACPLRQVGAARSEAASFLSNLASQRKNLAPDTAKVFSLYSSFDQTGSPAGEAKESINTGKEKARAKNRGSSTRPHAHDANDNICTIRALHRHVGKSTPEEQIGNVSFAGLAPMPTPEMSPSTSEMLFRNLVSLVSSGVHASRGQATGTTGLVDMTLDFVMHLTDANSAYHVAPRSTNLDLKPGVDSLLDELRNVPSSLKSHPVVLSCHVLAQYMALYLFDPLMVDVDTGAAVSPATYARVLKLTSACLHSLKSEEDGSARLEQKASEKDSGEEEREPTAIEQLVYILATVCRQHSSSLRQIATLAFEVVAEHADSSVTAVVFDLLETDAQADSESDNGDVSNGAEAESSDEEENSNLESERNEDTDDRTQMQLAAGDRDSSGSDLTGDEGSDEGGSDGSDEGDLADMMLDDEDPSTLEAYDKHLSNHMQLLKVEKKQNRRARLLSSRKAAGTLRLLDFVELLARHLRLKLEVGEESRAETALTSLDLLVRIIDYCYGEDANGIAHVGKFVNIFSKHLDRPLSSFPSNCLRELDACELLTRLFEALKAADTRRKAASNEVRMVSHTLTFVCHAAPDVKAVNELVSEGYGSLWTQFTSPANRFIGVNVFSSAVARVPSLSSSLISLALQTSVDVKASSGTRMLALQVLHAYIPAVRASPADDASSQAFWKGVSSILTRSSGDPVLGTKLWKHGVALGDLLRLVDSGLQSGELPVVCGNSSSDESIGTQVIRLLGTLKIPRPVEKKMKKTVKSILSHSPSEWIEGSAPASSDVGAADLENRTRDGIVVSEKATGGKKKKDKGRLSSTTSRG